MQSKAQVAVNRRALEVEPGSLRHQVLLTAQKFKSSWVELGALLVKVREGGAWGEWGFGSFEEYCSKELRIKKQTAAKLTASYSFLARHERAVVEPPANDDAEAPPAPPQEVPAFEVISVLAGAEERGQLGEQDYRALRESIWADERPPAQLARELTQRFPAPPKPAPAADLVVRRLAAAARKLAGELRGCERVPKGVAERAEALAEDIEELAQGGG